MNRTWTQDVLNIRCMSDFIGNLSITFFYFPPGKFLKLLMCWILCLLVMYCSQYRFTNKIKIHFVSQKFFSFIAEIGLGLIGFGIFFTFLAVILFFDRGLLALGNVSLSLHGFEFFWPGPWRYTVGILTFCGSVTDTLADRGDPFAWFAFYLEALY